MNASYSMEGRYSRPDDNNIQRMFRCKVAPGINTFGDSSALDQKKVSRIERYSDSFGSSDRKVLSLPKDHQAYPEYLVTFIEHSYYTNKTITEAMIENCLR